MAIARPLVLIRGGGDLASGTALRLHRTGFGVVISEIEQPLAVRRAVSFAEAVYAGEVRVEEVTGRRVDDVEQIEPVLSEQVIPVLVDPHASIKGSVNFDAVIDARMRKKPSESVIGEDEIIVGLGPGFMAGDDCHAVVETKRGHTLGRVIWDGPAQDDTGAPEPIQGYDVERVLRAPATGVLDAGLDIGTAVAVGDVVARVDNQSLLAPFDGVLRGLIHDGLEVFTGMKIGDLDPRGVAEYCFIVSDKALAVAGGVSEALLSFESIRKGLAA